MYRKSDEISHRSFICEILFEVWNNEEFDEIIWI
jgi:hypothetical protein